MCIYLRVLADLYICTVRVDEMIHYLRQARGTIDDFRQPAAAEKVETFVVMNVHHSLSLCTNREHTSSASRLYSRWARCLDCHACQLCLVLDPVDDGLSGQSVPPIRHQRPARRWPADLVEGAGGESAISDIECSEGYSRWTAKPTSEAGRGHQ